MATKSEPCRYCWRRADEPMEVSGVAHHEGCPELDPRFLLEWRRGRNFGFADNNIPYWQRFSYSPAFYLGWRVGKDEIDRLVEEAAEGNYTGPEY